MQRKSASLHFIKLSAIGLAFLLCGLVSGTAQALAQGVAQGYFSDDTALRPGMVVQLSDSSTASQPKVERADYQNPEKTIGLATSPKDSFTVIASGQQQVFVQSSGEAQAYVSSINGEVKKGDFLTISPLRGILMRANNNNASPVFGSALEDFPTESAEKYNVNGENGAMQETLVARIAINLDNRSFTQGEVPNDSILSKIGRSVLGREIGEIRVLIGLIIFLIVLVAEGGIIYGAVSSSITAVGRNPLASKLIRKELVRVLGIALAVLAMGLGTIYAVLSV